MPVALLSTKLHIPPLRTHVVARARLVERLEAGLHRRLTLLSAPAGCGKTTLLSEWAAQREWPAAWVTLDEGDNDPDRFLSYLVNALKVIEPSAGPVEDLLAARRSLPPLPFDPVLTLLINQLSMAASPLVLVLDDYHVIVNREIHGVLAYLLDHLPPKLHLLISSRTSPPLPVARLRAKDQLNEFSEADLRFTFDETRVFLNDVMNVKLSSEEIAELEARTEGWITGLQLVGLSLQDRGDSRALIETLSGTHRYILDYLAEEVLGDLPAVLQAFLLRVSILQRLSGGLCDAVVGDLGLWQLEIDGSAWAPSEPLRAEAMLEFLDASNLFIIPLDYERRWYRFHSLFAGFLQNRLAAKHPNEIAQLHRRASTWYAAQGFPSEAIGHALAAGDPDRAAGLIEVQVTDLLARGELSTLLRWIDHLPPEVVQSRARLLLARAWMLLIREPARFRDAADEQMALIARCLGLDSTDALPALRVRTAAPTVRADLCEFAMLQAYASRDSGNPARTIELFAAVLEYVPEDQLLIQAFALAGLASTYARAGAIAQAERAFAQAAEISRLVHSVYGFVAATDWQATMQVMQGKLPRAAVTYRQAIEYLSDHAGGPLPLTGHAFVGLADLLLEQNDLHGALQHVAKGIELGKQVSDHDATREGYIIQARVHSALGDDRGTQEALRNAQRTALELGSTTCLNDAMAWKARLDLAAGDIDAGARWAAARGFGEVALPGSDEPLQEIELLTYCRLLLAQRSPASAVPVLERLLARAEADGRMRTVVEILALEALCYQAQGRAEEAVRTVARALLKAEAEGFVRVFVGEGVPMAALLRNAGAQGHAPEYVKRLLDAFGEGGSDDTPLEPLSQRELDILLLMADGSTNAQIAAALIIGHSTVKTHINRIYSKLGVYSRTQAVARARALHLLR